MVNSTIMRPGLRLRCSDTCPLPSRPLTAVFGDRSLAVIAGVLGALYRGHGFVPLSPWLPARSARILLERSGCNAVVVDEVGLDKTYSLTQCTPL